MRRRTVLPHRRGRRVIVSLCPGDYITVRDERSRREFDITIGAVYDIAVKAHVAALRAEKRKAKRR